MRKNKYIYQKYILIVCLLLSTGLNSIRAQLSGDYPYFESFLGGAKPSGIETPKPVIGSTLGTNSASFEKYGVQLTPTEYDKFGAFYLDGHEFTSSSGIFVSFEYMIYGGDKVAGKTGGDGMLMYLFDADEENPGIGAPGAGIGYTYNRTILKSPFNAQRSPGLKGAYLGIAFDSYGNFKKMRYQGESRVNGIPYNYGTTGTSETMDPESGKSYDGKNDVTIRGAMNPQPIRTSNTGGTDIPGMGITYGGYPVLVTQRTTDNIGFRMKTASDPNTNYAWMRYDQLKNSNRFPVRGGLEFENSTDPGYRKAFIELFPSENGGFYVSVYIQHGSEKDVIIYDYEYLAQFDYLENAIETSNGDNDEGETPRSQSPRRTLKLNLPLSFKLGFAAATGSSKADDPQRDTHVIKNLSVTLPRAAEAYDDFVPDEFQGVNSVAFEPLKNDFGYKGLIARVQDPCPECINPATFQFLKEDGTPSSTPYDYIVTGEGRWTYNPSTKIATFKPLSTFTGEARIRYNILGGMVDTNPYALEAYRSGPATIGVDILPSTNPPKEILISNKMITSKPRK